MTQVEKKKKITGYKLLFMTVVFVIYVVGRFIPLYGVDTRAYQEQMMDADSLLMQAIGGDSYQYSIFALGVSPYIISNMISQLVMLCMSSDYKAKVSPRKVQRAMLTGMLMVSMMQAFTQVNRLIFVPAGDIVYLFKAIAFLQMVTGAVLILWLSDMNQKYGIGGAMVLILFNITKGTADMVKGHAIKEMILPIVLSIVMFFITLALENTEKRIPLQRVSIHNIYADKNYMAIKYNPVGVMPVMFSTAFFMLPRLLVDLLLLFFPKNRDLLWWQDNLVMTKPLGIVVYLLIIYLLTIGFAMLMINPKDTMEQFLKSGDSIVNLHGGRPTRKYMRRTVFGISFFSATVMSICLGIPLFLQLQGSMEGTLTMLPSSIMMLTGLVCSFAREFVAIRSYDAYEHFIFI